MYKKIFPNSAASGDLWAAVAVTLKVLRDLLKLTVLFESIRLSKPYENPLAQSKLDSHQSRCVAEVAAKKNLWNDVFAVKPD